MPTVLPTTLDVIYLAIRAQLQNFLSLQDNQVLVMDPEVLAAHKHPANPRLYLVLWPAPESVNQPVFRGAARLDTRLLERLQVTVRTATVLDDYKEREIWLLDQGIGHLRLRHQIWDALAGFNPVDGNENALTVGPLEPAQSSRPKLTDDKHYYGESYCGFQFWYVAKLTQP